MARMKPAARLPRPWLPLTAVVSVALVACGTETAGSGADRAELEERARAAQVAIENVYVTEVPGYEVAKQSVGVLGADGFSATYVKQDSGAQIRLGVDRGTMDAANCPKLPVGVGTGGTGGAVECVEDGKSWYRTSGTQHEYVTEADGRLVRVEADTAAVERDTLRKAAEAAHAASDAELDAVLPPARAGAGQPVERGDLPPAGDGAPNNEVGVGG
ncbi:membrane protein [Streptomyces xantholiticus]|nr:membrane protein [Streptomyces xantholiticus]